VEDDGRHNGQWYDIMLLYFLNVALRKRKSGPMARPWIRKTLIDDAHVWGIDSGKGV